MLENPTPTATHTAAATTADPAIKRYAPPNQRSLSFSLFNNLSHLQFIYYCS